METCKPSATPFMVGTQLTDEGDLFSNPTLYRKLVRSLQYLIYTSLDTAFTVNKLSQFLVTPKQQHWQAWKILLRYLKATLGLGLLFTPSSHLNIEVYTNADHAGCKITKKSTSGLCVYLGAKFTYLEF